MNEHDIPFYPILTYIHVFDQNNLCNYTCSMNKFVIEIGTYEYVQPLDENIIKSLCSSSVKMHRMNSFQRMFYIYS